MPKYRAETHRCLAAEYRARRGVKQKEVADAIGMNQSEYSKIERGGRQLFSTDLIKLTKYFGCTADQLLGLSEIVDTKPISRPLKRDLAFYYTKHKTGEGVDISEKNISMVERPFFLDGCEGCAAVVANNRMSPRFEEGEIVYIDFDGEAESGDYIFVILNHYETDSGLICQLEEWLPDGVVAKFSDGSTEKLVGDAVKRIGQIVGSRKL